MTKEYEELSIHLKDDQYPFVGVDHVREISRAIVMNENGQIAIHRIYRDDRFCKQGYFETPGGGVDEGETSEQAIIRECEEEIGYKVEIVAKIGDVFDFYNLIKRENHNHFYLCKTKEFIGKHFVSSGDAFIQETLWVDIDQAISMYKQMPDDMVSGLVKARELPIIEAAKKLIETL